MGREFEEFKLAEAAGALFHTQGGLEVDAHARVLRTDKSPLPNLYAGGGAACGIPGSQVWGYLSVNGLLTAVNLRRLAGRTAAKQIEVEGNKYVD